MIGYHYELKYLPFIKSLDVFERYHIYSRYMIIHITLNAICSSPFNYYSFHEMSDEALADFYSRHKDKCDLSDGEYHNITHFNKFKI